MLAADFFLVCEVLPANSGFRRGLSSWPATPTAREASSTWTTGLLVMGRDFDGGVGLAGGRAADEKRDGKTLALHFAGDMRHLVQRRGDQAAEADHVHLLLAGGLQDFFARHHDAQVNDFVIVAAEDDADDVFADVMDVALDGGEEDFALGLMNGAAGLFLGFHERQEIGDGLLHDAGAFDDLGQEHFARAEEVADDAHASHQAGLR